MKFYRKLAFVAAITASSLTSAIADPLSPAQVEQVKKVVHEYLVANPQVLVEASKALQKQEMAKAEQKAEGAISQNKGSLFNDPDSPVAGNPKGDVTLVEFFDYQCSHCRKMASAIDQLIENNSNLRVVFKEFPIFGGASQYAAMAALAANKQGKYYAFHDALMNVDGALDKAKILKIAKRVGLNTTRLQKEMKASWIKAQIKENYKLAQKLGVMGTPAFVVGNESGSKTKFYPGATSSKALQNLIDQVS